MISLTKTTIKHWLFAGSFMLLFPLFLSSCNDDSPAEQTGVLSLNMAYFANETLLQEGEQYPIPNSNLEYSVEKLTFYISGIELKNTNGESVSFPDIFLIDMTEGTAYWNMDEEVVLSALSLPLANVPVGTYNELSLTIGLSDADNQDGGLPNTTEHINMLWPEPIGGGYHFMKFEGKFTENGGEPQGFAVHTGRLSNDIATQTYSTKVTIPLGDQAISLSSAQPSELRLAYNATQWFSNATTLMQFPRMIMNNHEAQQAYQANVSTGLITLNTDQ